MLPVKLPYYPKLQATMIETRFGVLEISLPKTYDKPLANKIIVRVDTLECLRSQLGDECFICRELLYTILAGQHEIYDPNDVLASYYRKYKPFTEYVNDKYYFGDDSIPILERVALPLRESVNEYRNTVMDKLGKLGGKYLVQTHDYVYYSFNVKPNLEGIEGVTVIC